MLIYCDSSALVKLVIEEPESAELAAFIQESDGEIVASRIAETELQRAVGRRLADTQSTRADRGELSELMSEKVTNVLLRITFIEVTPSIARIAGALEPVTLRSLDAIHLSSSLVLADEIETFICYDDRLSQAARRLGFVVASPA